MSRNGNDRPVLGFLASDPAITPVLVAIRESSEMSLGPGWASVALPSGVLSVPSWDELLENPLPDLFIVSGASEPVLAGVRQLVTLKVPIVVVTDSLDGPQGVFQLASTWQDAPERVTPLFLSGVRPIALRRLEDLSRQGIKTVWKVEFERVHTPTHDETFDWTLCDRLFLQDLDWMESLFGPHELVTQHSTMRGEDQIQETTVRLEAEPADSSRIPEVLWALSRGMSESQWTLRLFHEEDVVTIRASSRISDAADSHVPTHSLEDGVKTEILDQLHGILSRLRDGVPLRSMEEVTRLGEFGAAAKRSRQRRRTIVVQHEDSSERSQFKSQMAAFGCGALLWTIFGSVAMLVLAASIDPRDGEQRLSEAAGYILSQAEFQDDSWKLSGEGKGTLRGIASSWSATSPVLIIEKSAANPNLDRQREQTVVAELRDMGVRMMESRIAVRELHGRWFRPFVLSGWAIVFAPIGIALGAQALILVARTEGDGRGSA